MPLLSVSSPSVADGCHEPGDTLPLLHTLMLTPRDLLKQEAARKAVSTITSGMRLGLGYGSTAKFVVDAVGDRLREGSLRDILCVPAAEGTAKQARELNIPLTTLDETPELDLAIDGADEVDPNLDLVKGLGGALLREKLVAMAAREFVVVVDGAKLVPKLGIRAPLPVEVVRFGSSSVLPHLRACGAEPQIRKGADGNPFITDEGHYIYDCAFAGGIDNAAALENRLCSRAGIVETGLFLGIASRVYVAEEGGVRILTRP